MIKSDENSNAQTWELEITCKNREYLKAVVMAILKYGMVDFEVNSVEGCGDSQGVWEGRYTVLMWCSWFHNLKNIVDDLAEIEERLENQKDNTI
jgi:hypothetical protein